METRPELKTKGVEAVDKALKILSLFEFGRPKLSLGEISAATGLAKSSILRLMISLQNSGYVNQTSDKRYTVGAETFRIGSIYQQNLNLETIVRPVLSEMVAECDESSSFFRREGQRRICVFREDANQLLREFVAEGDSAPISKGAAGTVFVWYEKIRGDEVASAPDLKRLPIISIGERTPGIAGMSVPVFSLTDGMIGALTLSGPVVRFSPEKIETMKNPLLRAGAKITRALGARFYDGFSESK
jgi:DNA-binding IclR family transcriptional regulator